MSTNVVSMEISQEQSDEIDRLLGELDARLGTLPVLSIAERVRLVKMGRKNPLKLNYLYPGFQFFPRTRGFSLQRRY